MWQPAAGRLIGLAVVLLTLSGALSGPLTDALSGRLGPPLSADPSAEPSPTPTPTGAVVPTPPVTPTAEPVPTLPVTPTPKPTPTRSASPTPTATPSATATVVAVPAVPPAIATSAISPTALFIAVGVLLAGAIFLWWLVRRRPPPAPAMPPTAQPVPTPVLLDSMATLGTAMIDSGYPVGLIHDALGDLATASGRPTVQAVVFPTSILVSAADDDGAQTRAVAAGESSYLLYQIDMVDHIVAVARRRPGAAPWVGRQAARVADAPPPFSRAQRIGASGLLSAALSVLLGASWLGVLVAGVLGVAVGVVLLTTERVAAGSQALVVVSVSLGVALAVLLVAHTVDPGVLPAMVAPLVILLPGGLLTIAVIELATGQIMSGAARAAAGAMRLLLLATGIVAASALIGIPARDPLQLNPLGPVAPWIAVAVFGIGITVYQCARRSSVGWILVVLYVAYGAQVVADVFFDGVLSALVGAAVMTPVAVVIARERTGPPAIASFLPAFWLLVPGALGLVGVAGVLEGDLDATSTIITTVATMIAIALGVLVGLAIAGTLSGSASGDDPVDADELIRESDAGA